MNAATGKMRMRVGIKKIGIVGRVIYPLKTVI
jgi:hypothetical protein